MRKKFSLLLVLVLLAGVVGLAGTAVEPRAVGSGVWLFDNETGGTTTKLVILFDQVVALESPDIVALGGEEATKVTVREILLTEAGSYCVVTIEVEVVAGGTLQVTLSGDSADAQIVTAYWF